MQHASFQWGRSRSTVLRTFRYVALVGVSIVMAGCGYVPMSQESSKEIRSIEINPTITIPDKPDVDGAVDVGSNIVLGLLLGASPLPRQVGYRFGVYMDANDVKMDEIVLRTFRRRLKEQHDFELREDADAILELAVIRYGFKMPALDITKNRRRPELLISATLRSKDSTVLWRNQKNVMRGSGSTYSHPIWSLWDSPRLVERSLEQASCIVAYLLLSDLRGAQPAPDGTSNDVPEGPVCDPVVKIETRSECKPGAGCVHHKTETWTFEPSRTPPESMCDSEIGCSRE